MIKILVLISILLNFSAEGAVMNEQSQKISNFFRNLNIDHMELVERFYDKNAEFRDPVVDIRGVSALRDYYAGLYKNVKSIRFDFSDEVVQGNDHVVVWKMTLLSDSLNDGKEFSIDGNSFIRFGGSDGKVIFHRDYFDMGAFIYERVPVLGRVIRYIKGKLASH
jgi:ketosteroid isomerase-like protein